MLSTKRVSRARDEAETERFFTREHNGPFHTDVRVRRRGPFVDDGKKKKQYDVLPRRTAEYSVLSRLAHIRTAHRSLSAKPDDGNLLLVFTVQLIVRTVWCNSCGKAYVNTVCCTRRYLCVRAAKKKRIVNKQTRQILITTLTIFVSERTRAV